MLQQLWVPSDRTEPTGAGWWLAGGGDWCRLDWGLGGFSFCVQTLRTKRLGYFLVASIKVLESWREGLN